MKSETHNELLKLQEAEYNILVEFKRICNKHSLTYYLDSGTLLGAIRHGGFIPWDDDIDVTMPLKDYLQFNKIAKEELPDYYYLQNYQTDEEYSMSFTKIVDLKTKIFIDNNSFKEYLGPWIDIFPLFHVSGENEYKIDKVLLKLSNVTQVKKRLKEESETFNRRLGKATTFFLNTFSLLPVTLRQRTHSFLLWLLFHSFSQKYLVYSYLYMSTYVPSEWFGNQKRYMLFVNEEFCVPLYTEEYLHKLYGNYMELPPLEERHGHLL